MNKLVASTTTLGSSPEFESISFHFLAEPIEALFYSGNSAHRAVLRWRKTTERCFCLLWTWEWTGSFCSRRLVIPATLHEKKHYPSFKVFTSESYDCMLLLMGTLLENMLSGSGSLELFIISTRSMRHRASWVTAADIDCRFQCSVFTHTLDDHCCNF